MNIMTIEGRLAIVAVLLILFSAMWDPRLAMVVAIGIYQFVKIKK